MKLEKSNEMLKEKVDSLKKSAQVNPFVPSATFLIPWKQKTVRFSDVFKGQRKGALGTNELKDFVKSTKNEEVRKSK